MNYRKFLAIFLPLVLLPSLLVLFLPGSISLDYVDVLEIVTLMGSGLLALEVAASYRKQLRMAFIFLAFYLIILGVAIIALPRLEVPLGTAFMGFVLGMQVVSYAMLVLSCLYILKAVDARKLNGTGWGIFAMTLLVCLFVALYPPLSSPLGNISFQFVSALLIRLVDAALIIALMPVICLYIQYLRTQHQQSLTFTVIVAGIVFSTIFDFIFQSVVTAFPNLLLPDSTLYKIIPEIIYSYGFSVIAVGLYTHLKHDEWGFQAIEKALA